ncbi:MAG: hypothetical protein GAK45_01651 [Pseudomonas citronellolis]|nr:MAG: hypothetical protein GAK45_01651 [Pseudomonas citronellolis]
MSLSLLFAELPFSLWQWLLMEAAVILAYVVFGIAGFGTALIAAPLLASSLPLARIIPLLVVLDFTASFGNWIPSRKSIDRRELLRLLPLMALGCAVGVYGLATLRSDRALLLLGLFVSAYALYVLFLQKPRSTPLAGAWVVPFGLFGGLFGALFGSGGFLYSLYLSGRLAAKEPIRATQSALIGCSTCVRLVLFGIAGFYTDAGLWLLAACLLPAMAAGLWIGRRITLRLSREAFVRVVTWLVLCSGLVLVGRALNG